MNGGYTQKKYKTGAGSARSGSENAFNEPLMKHVLHKVRLWVSTIRLLPHWLLFNLHANRGVMQYDAARWLALLHIHRKTQAGFLHLMTFVPEFRNLFYYRAGGYALPLKLLCPPLRTLYLEAGQIGPGLFIQHGFATIIAARSVGKDCWINQQVTIGFSNPTDQPVIEDNVTIHAGAKVIGKVTVGSNSKIGANAVVVKDVPENCTVVGVPAYIVRRNGLRVTQEL